MDLGIYGAGGLGRELLILALQINEVEKRWNSIIFIDDDCGLPALKGRQVYPFEEVKQKYNRSILEIVVAVGEPQIRRKLRERINDKGFRLAVLIHPSVNIPGDTSLGAGTTICKNCFVSCDIAIGENVLMQPCASIGHDSQIGNDTVISSYVCVAGGCFVGHETYIGLNVPIKENIRIGNQTIVGMGSVVTRDIPGQVIAMGNPARAQRENVNHKVFNRHLPVSPAEREKTK